MHFHGEDDRSSNSDVHRPLRAGIARWQPHSPPGPVLPANSKPSTSARCGGSVGTALAYLDALPDRPASPAHMGRSDHGRLVRGSSRSAIWPSIPGHKRDDTLISYILLMSLMLPFLGERRSGYGHERDEGDGAMRLLSRRDEGPSPQ